MEGAKGAAAPLYAKQRGCLSRPRHPFLTLTRERQTLIWERLVWWKGDAGDMAASEPLTLVNGYV